ncbi:uncharacterized protein DNG_02601 [Cephalotrichum gorgonifer]|uniref:Pre-mRNA-splicing factor 38B n=1 Tax=Cephalotrichum gorgonifer TaxID=2041049 RepID=A0AAE8MV30_9PEZI|nr:uncharacterized protein DNG_02601 [Cephalotrichum gorgonifer]
MANDELLTDEYVAGLLAKDAQDCSLKFSTIGMDAYRSDKKPANLPKPNTRFLRNVIKDTNSHNAALLAKEAAESRARLEKLGGGGRGRTAKPGDVRKRQIGSINAILGNKAPKRSAEETSSHKGSRRDLEEGARRRDGAGKPDRTRDGRDTERGRHSREEDASHRRKRRRRDGSSSDEDRHRSRRGESTHRRRSRSPSRREERRHRERSTSRHRRPRSSRSHRDSDRHRDSRKKSPEPVRERDRDNHESDSDPLEEFIGPAPPPKSPIRTKGRGTISAFSGIDQRFAADYDPKLDVDLDADVDPGGKGDWSEAVEAFRDRQKLRLAQEERMKSAGFSEEDVGRWKDARGEKTEADVRWAKAGEEREWDIGKELGSD